MRPSSRLSLLITAAALLAIGLLFDGLPREPERASVLLVTLDTTRADHLRTYGYFRRTTPNLDALARRSLTFDAAWAPMATTLPSHTSLMTGAWPLEHGVLGNVEHGGRRTLPSDALVPVATLLSEAGWQTAAFVSAAPLASGTGIERGFERFDQPEKLHRSAKLTTDAAMEWLRQRGRDPFFLWVHYYDPHGPFTPPVNFDRFEADEALTQWLGDRAIPEIARRTGGAELDPVEAHDLYDGELLYMDAQIGRLLRLLDRRGISDRTVVVVVGDHGEGLGQHDIGGHGHVWREQLQVPLWMYVPWLPGRRIEAPVAMVDVVPTLLGLIRVPGAGDWIARSSGHDGLRGPTGPLLGLSSIRQTALGVAPQRALTVGRWRYVEVDGEGRLFDLGTDPHELRDLEQALPFHREVLARWTDRVEAEQRARGARLGTAGQVDLSTDELEGLRELGYLEP